MYGKGQIREIGSFARRKGVIIVPEFDPLSGLGHAFEFGREEHGALHFACPDCDDDIGSCYVVSCLICISSSLYIVDII